HRSAPHRSHLFPRERSAQTKGPLLTGSAAPDFSRDSAAQYGPVREKRSDQDRISLVDPPSKSRSSSRRRYRGGMPACQITFRRAPPRTQKYLNARPRARLAPAQEPCSSPCPSLHPQQCASLSVCFRLTRRERRSPFARPSPVRNPEP